VPRGVAALLQGREASRRLGCSRVQARPYGRRVPGAAHCCSCSTRSGLPPARYDSMLSRRCLAIFWMTWGRGGGARAAQLACQRATGRRAAAPARASAGALLRRLQSRRREAARRHRLLQRCSRRRTCPHVSIPAACPAPTPMTSASVSSPPFSLSSISRDLTAALRNRIASSLSLSCGGRGALVAGRGGVAASD
jgi:hypothetical protein